MKEDIAAIIKEKLDHKLSNFSRPSDRRIYCVADSKDIVAVAKTLFWDLGLRFATATAAQLENGFEILYHFSFDKTGQLITVRTLLKDKEHPETESITPVFKAAEWIEREMHEILGIHFKNHPNLTHLLLVDDWPEGEYPLRKDTKHKSNDK
ncbi:MAG: NADH-quinone oxidoreductase subunit C [Candidatus Omnitrophota bacterium]|nr:NADH-quinone oxidoreductase subunit C [Candidatus Omnitrophota bacterium]